MEIDTNQTSRMLSPGPAMFTNWKGKRKKPPAYAEGLMWWRFRDSNPGHADYDCEKAT